MSERLHIDELSSIIKTHGNKESRNFFRARAKSSELRILAAAYSNHPALTESEIAIRQFEELRSSAHFRVLRGALIEKLQGRLFHLSFKHGSKLLTATYQNNRKVFMIKTLILLGAWRPAMRLFSRTLAQAYRFELTGNVVDLLGIAVVRHAISGDAGEYLHYSREMDTALNLLRAEFRASRLRFDLGVTLAKSSHRKALLVAQVESTVNQLEEIRRAFPTFGIMLGYFRTSSMCHEILGDYSAALRECIAAEYHLLAKPDLSSPSFHEEFALKRLAYSLFLRDTKAGHEAISLCERYFDRGSSNNWFVAKEYEFLLFMHDLNFQAASQLFDDVTGHPRFKLQRELVVQKWQLFGMHLTLVLHNYNNPPASFPEFVKEVPIFAKDKIGYNVSLLILHIIILLSSEKLDDVLIRIESLQRYVNRYLKAASPAQRAFIRALIQLEKSNFDFEEVTTRLPSQLAKFRDTELQGPPDDCQVLPYGYMWDLIGATLKLREKRLAKNDRRYSGAE